MISPSAAETLSRCAPLVQFFFRGPCLALATTVVVLDSGRVAAAGPAEAILRRADLAPVHDAEAGALLDMVVEASDPDSGLTHLTGSAGRLLVPGLARPVGTRLRVRIPARDVLLATARPQGLSARNVLVGHICGMASSGTEVAVEIDCNGARLVARVTLAAVRDLHRAPRSRTDIPHHLYPGLI